jgi:hypothetical protein
MMHSRKRRRGARDKPASTLNKDSLAEKINPRTSTSVNTKVQPPKDFPQFSRLPKELRLKIWETVTDEQRVVVIHTLLGYPGGWIPTSVPGAFYSSTPIPAALHVCSESRKIALKRYTLSFSTRHLDWNPDQPARIWFNFERDALYFREPPWDDWHDYVRFGSVVAPRDLERVQNLGIGIPYFGPRMRRSPLFGHFLRALKGLNTFYVCREDPRLDFTKSLKFCPIRGNKERNFVQDYRWHLGGDGRFKGLGVPAALEKIKVEVLPESLLEERKIPEVCLVTIATS